MSYSLYVSVHPREETMRMLPIGIESRQRKQNTKKFRADVHMLVDVFGLSMDFSWVRVLLANADTHSNRSPQERMLDLQGLNPYVLARWEGEPKKSRLIVNPTPNRSLTATDLIQFFWGSLIEEFDRLVIDSTGTRLYRGQFLGASIASANTKPTENMSLIIAASITTLVTQRPVANTELRNCSEIVFEKNDRGIWRRVM